MTSALNMQLTRKKKELRRANSVILDLHKR